jgi:hypothetical protein
MNTIRMYSSETRVIIVTEGTPFEFIYTLHY